LKQLKQLNYFKKVPALTEELGLVLELPLALLYFLGYFKYAPPVVMVLLNAPGDIPGSIKRKVNAILVSIGLTMVITTIILFQNLFYLLCSNYCYNLFYVATFCLWL
jgi:hypothetical protein